MCDSDVRECTTTRLEGTLSEKTSIGPLRNTVVPLMRPTVNAAPFTDGCVVMTTKLDGRKLVAPPPRLLQLAPILAMLLRGRRNNRLTCVMAVLSILVTPPGFLLPPV